MLREKIPIGRAKKLRYERAIEVLQIVRKERGKKARGDFLFHSAVNSLRSSDADAAKAYLEKFLSVIPNVIPEHRAIVNVVLTKLLAHRKLKVPSTFLNFLDLILGILKLVGRNLLSCQPLGIYIPVYIDDRQS
jgi:hypothetical protein